MVPEIFHIHLTEGHVKFQWGGGTKTFNVKYTAIEQE